MFLAEINPPSFTELYPGNLFHWLVFGGDWPAKYGKFLDRQQKDGKESLLHHEVHQQQIAIFVLWTSIMRSGKPATAKVGNTILPLRLAKLD